MVGKMEIMARSAKAIFYIPSELDHYKEQVAYKEQVMGNKEYEFLDTELKVFD